MRPYFVVGVGSNVGSREALLRAAELLLSGHDALTVSARSALYVTPPVGPPQPDFLNAALRVETELGPPAMLDVALAIEAQLGRVRRQRWGPRTLDLDLLAWSEGRFADDRVTVPHPRLLGRAFALAPLSDVAPSLDVGAGRVTAPPSRPWTPLPSEAPLTVEALDPLDAWALGATAWTGAPEAGVTVEPLSVAPGELLPPCPVRCLYALERSAADGLHGWRLRGREPAVRSGPAEVHLGPARARLERPKLL